MQKYKTIDDFLDDLDADQRSQVDILRSLILETQPQLQERIKWNAPSYVLDGEDRITFNLANKQRVVKLILHMGVTRKENKKGTPILKDESGLVEWSSDIRGIVTFSNSEEVNLKLTSLKSVIKKWLLIPAKMS